LSGDAPIVGETTDLNGMRVVLLRRVWQEKVVVDHPEMASFVDDVLETVSDPDHIEPDPIFRDRIRYYARDLGPSEWLLVVVSYEQAQARIVSAFANRKDPPRWRA
jgi:hypothetical protein